MDALLILYSDIKSKILIPWSRFVFTSSTCSSVNECLRPNLIPLRLANSIPCTCRSLRKSFSKVAIAPSIVNRSIPVGVDVSICWSSTTSFTCLSSSLRMMFRRSRVERARRSNFVITSESPSRT